MDWIKPIHAVWFFVIILIQTGVILGCMNETLYQENCLGPFSELVANETAIQSICETDYGKAVFDCMFDELQCQTHGGGEMQDEFRQRFQGLDYYRPLICEAYGSQLCFDTVECAMDIYKYSTADLYGFYDFFCGHSNSTTIKRAIGCMENAETQCPETFNFINNTDILNSGSTSITFGDLNDRLIKTECPKVTDLDVACLTEKEIELAECGVQTNLALNDSTIQCAYYQVSGQCIATVCSSTLADFIINLFQYIQCGVQRVACPPLEDNYGTWTITLVGEQAVIQCEPGIEAAYRRTCHGGGTWGAVTDECTPSTTQASSTSTTTTSTSSTASPTTTTTATTTTTPTTTTTKTTTTTIPQTTTPIDVPEAVSTLGGLVGPNGGGDDPPSQAEVQQLGSALQNVATGLKQQMANKETVTLDDKDTDIIMDAADKMLTPEALQFLKTPSDSGESTLNGGLVLDVMETVVKATQERVCNNLAPGGSKQTKRDNLELGFGKKTNEDIVFPGGSDSYKASIQIPALTLANQGVSETCFGGLYYPTIQDALKPGDTIGGYTEGTSLRVTNAVVNSDVVSILLSDQPGLSVDNLDPPIMVTYDIEDSNLTDPICAFWDDNANNKEGEWSSKGCRVKAVTNKTVVCECTHLTNFAVLMSPKKISGSHAKALSIISAVGCGLSILCLLATIIIHWVVWRFVRSDRSVILMNVCVVLLLALVMFLAGINRTESKEACKAIAALLQFLFLTVFFLMLLAGIEILISIVHVYTTKFRTKVLLPLSYVVPAIIVGVSLGITEADGYGTDEFCWLDIESGLIWAFIGPVLLVILINFIVILIVFKKMASTTLLRNKTLKSKVQTSVRSICVLVPIMGLSWILGVVSVNTDTPIFAYLFAIFNTLQGLFIFLMHCVFNRQVQEALKHKQARRKSLRSFTASYRNQSQSRSFSADHDLENSKRKSQISYIKDGSENSSNSGKDKRRRSNRNSESDSYRDIRKTSWPNVKWT